MARNTSAVDVSTGKIPGHLIAYYYIVDGRLFVHIDNAPAIEAHAGEIVLLPSNAGHVLGSAPGLRAEVIDGLVQAASEHQPSGAPVDAASRRESCVAISAAKVPNCSLSRGSAAILLPCPQARAAGSPASAIAWSDGQSPSFILASPTHGQQKIIR